MRSTQWDGRRVGVRVQAQFSAAEQAAGLDPPMKPNSNIIPDSFPARLVSPAIAWLGFGVLAALVSVGLVRTMRR